MNQIQRATSQSIALPDPGIPISFRAGTLEDLPAIDALQKKYHKELGFFPRAQMEGYLRNGWVLVAEGSGQWPVVGGQLEKATLLTTDHRPPTTRLLGYCVSRDRYLKRDELGVIFQLCVEPGAQRKFIGAALLKEVFERSPYGCRLYCCWCAQDLPANRFWESMGLVPLAFRTGSAKRGKKGAGRTHIFWQKRIVSGDEATPYWFPSQTTGGAIGEGRLVLPIPSGVRWDGEMPVLLPEENPKSEALNSKQIQSTKSEGSKRKVTSDLRPLISAEKPARTNLSASVAFFRKSESLPERKIEKPARVAKPKVKIPPQLITATRELRDRWLEKVNAGEFLPDERGKYAVGRVLPMSMPKSAGLLEAA